MKKVFYILFLLVGLSISTFAQKYNIPPGIPKQVYYMQISQYPKGTDLIWKVMPDSTYKVFFKVDGRSGYAHYGQNSAATEAQTEIDSASLPRAIVLAIDSHYAGYRYKIVTHFVTSTPLEYQEPFLKYVHDHYQVLLTKGKNSYKLYFTPDGQLLNRPEMKIME